MKRPASQYYWGDWRRDTALQACSLAARGLWHEMNCLMHDCEPYGHLCVGAAAMKPTQLARLVGITPKECADLLDELEGAGVFSRTDDGVIYSRRMVRDEALRERRANGGHAGAEHGIKGKDFGSLGGRGGEFDGPGILYAVRRLSGGAIKIGVTRHLKQRLSAMRGKLDEAIEVLGTSNVGSMREAEAYMLEVFKGRRDGEWINAEWGVVRDALSASPHPPFQPPPASASASAVGIQSNLAVAPAFPPEKLPPLALVGEPEPQAKGPPDCPHLAVLALWAEVLPALPQHLPGQWKGARADHLRARWRETADEKGWRTAADGLAYLRKLFAYVGRSAFLTGRESSHGKRPFFVELEWLVRPVNWAKVHEGKYHPEKAA